MKRIQNFIKNMTLPALVALALALPVAGLAVVPAYAGGPCADGVGRGIQLTNPDGTTGCTDEEGEGFGALAKQVINIFSIVVGAISVIMIIIGGFRYIISGGDSNGVTGAKNTIMYAIIGLVIVLFAQVIIRFVFTQAQPE